MRSGILCYIFPFVEFCVIFFCVWNVLWCYVFLHVQHALLILIIGQLLFPHRMIIVEWWCSIPQTEAKGKLDSVPI